MPEKLRIGKKGFTYIAITRGKLYNNNPITVNHFNKYTMYMLPEIISLVINVSDVDKKIIMEWKLITREISDMKSFTWEVCC